MNLAKIVQKRFSTAAATAEKPASKKISFEQLKKSRALNFNLTTSGCCFQEALSICEFQTLP
jgi:hypothetical protein